ncbi:MAG TPA: hypothetical protein VMD75_10515 [Candidatus Binataceae bacterium]|nr:hypothetical protein [Candidatus Binataceae bacterium]
MKTALTLFSAFALTCALALPAAAQYVTQGDVNSFNGFLNNHPQVASQLQRNPDLVDNKAYLDEHPELHSFLADHDQLRRAIQTHPGMFERQGGRYAYRWGKGPNGGWKPEWNHRITESDYAQMRNYGYTDPATHQWHNREWWEKNRPDWVKEHHPNWQSASAEHHHEYPPAEHPQHEMGVPPGHNMGTYNGPNHTNEMAPHPNEHPNNNGNKRNY